MVRKLRRIVLICAAAAAVFGMAARAEAITIPVDSFINLGGTATVFPDTWFVDVSGDYAVVACAPPNGCTGVYAGFNMNPVAVVHNDFNYNQTYGGGLDPNNYVPGYVLWSINSGAYRFELLESFGASDPLNPHVIDIVGSGWAIAPGYDPSLAIFAFTGSTMTGTYGFTSQVVVPGGGGGAGVPDGGSTAALLGSILIGFGIVRRRFFNA